MDSAHFYHAKFATRLVSDRLLEQELFVVAYRWNIGSNLTEKDRWAIAQGARGDNAVKFYTKGGATAAVNRFNRQHGAAGHHAFKIPVLQFLLGAAQ